MKARKVYGINGLLEWHGTVDSNGVRMKVDFANGSVTAFGVAPATYSTEDELTQFIMENSEQYKSGRIKLIQTIALPGEEEPEKREALEEESGEPELEVVEVSCLDDAKDYLADNYSVNRGSMRSTKAVKEVGKSYNIEFKGI